MTDNPDSVIKHQKFEDLMKRYHGQMENALYAAETICPTYPICEGCPFLDMRYSRLEPPEEECKIRKIRTLLGDHVEQHDIIIPDDNSRSERKRNR